MTRDKQNFAEMKDNNNSHNITDERKCQQPFLKKERKKQEFIQPQLQMS